MGWLRFRLEDRLWGVESDEAIREIERKLMPTPQHRPLGHWYWPNLLRGMITAVPLSVCAWAAAEWFDLRGWWRTIAFIVMVLAVGNITMAWNRHAATRNLAEGLHAMGRCAQCGYALDPEVAVTCPKCGRIEESCNRSVASTQGGNPSNQG